MPRRGFDVAEGVALPEEVKRLLDSSFFFGGSNGFVGAHEKEHLITRLRQTLSETTRRTWKISSTTYEKVGRRMPKASLAPRSGVGRSLRASVTVTMEAG
jgi:hypothetical protein